MLNYLPLVFLLSASNPSYEARDNLANALTQTQYEYSMFHDNKSEETIGSTEIITTEQNVSATDNSCPLVDVYQADIEQRLGLWPDELLDQINYVGLIEDLSDKKVGTKITAAAYSPAYSSLLINVSGSKEDVLNRTKSLDHEIGHHLFEKLKSNTPELHELVDKLIASEETKCARTFIKTYEVEIPTLKANKKRIELLNTFSEQLKKYSEYLTKDELNFLDESSAKYYNFNKNYDESGIEALLNSDEVGCEDALHENIWEVTGELNTYASGLIKNKQKLKEITERLLTKFEEGSKEYETLFSEYETATKCVSYPDTDDDENELFARATASLFDIYLEDARTNYFELDDEILNDFENFTFNDKQIFQERVKKYRSAKALKTQKMPYDRLRSLDNITSYHLASSQILCFNTTDDYLKFLKQNVNVK